MAVRPGFVMVDIRIYGRTIATSMQLGPRCLIQNIMHNGWTIGKQVHQCFFL